MKKLSDYIFQYLAEQEVKHVFLLSGGGCMHLVDSLGRNQEIEYVPCLHEQVASIAAGAYAQYTNDLGICLVTTGPGGTNAITGVAAAWADSIPLLVISGQVKRNDLALNTGLRFLGYQEIDIVSIVKPITKYAVTVMEPKEIKYHLDKAIYLAKSGRKGPVWLDIPLDVQASLIDEQDLAHYQTAQMESKISAVGLADQVKQTLELLSLAERPVILAGYGIRLAGVTEQFLELINCLNIPVLTTWKGMDLLPEENPLFFGRPGCIGGRAPNFIQQNADLVIAIGARLDYGQIGFNHKNFAREAKKVIVDIDPAELKKFDFETKIAINADAGEFIDQLLQEVKGGEGLPVFKGACPLKKETLPGVQGTKPLKKDWLSQCQEWKQKYPVILPEYWQKKDFVSNYALVDVLSDSLNDKDIIITGSAGACSEVFNQCFRVKHGQKIFYMPGLGAMGCGLPASIGGCFASAKNRTICINGDGGFQLNIQDLETIKQFNLPIKFFILNNQGYGSIRNSQKNFFNSFFVASDPSSKVILPETSKIADAYGIKNLSIKNNSEIKSKVAEVLNFSGPIICEVMVDPNEATMPKTASQVLPDGRMVSKPLEDLWPFLDREEFNANMIIEPLEE